jgi:hypothetical protein
MGQLSSPIVASPQRAETQAIRHGFSVASDFAHITALPAKAPMFRTRIFRALTIWREDYLQKQCGIRRQRQVWRTMEKVLVPALP